MIEPTIEAINRWVSPARNLRFGVYPKGTFRPNANFLSVQNKSACNPPFTLATKRSVSAWIDQF